MNASIRNPAAQKYVGSVALRYDEKRAAKNHRHIDDSRITEAFLDKCNPGSTVADIPTGTGRALRAVLDRGFRYVGIDVSPHMIAVCKKKIAGDSRAQAFVADARSTGLSDGAADYLISIKFIKWLPTEQMVFDALTEFRRICRKRALVNVKIAVDKPKLRRTFLFRILRALRQRSPANLPSSTIEPATFEALSERVGWTIVEIIDNPVIRGSRFYVLEASASGG